MKVKTILWYIYISVVMAVMVTFGYKAFYPFEPIRMDSFYIDKQVLRHGEKFCIQMVGEKLLDVPVDVTISFANGESYQVVKYSSNVHVGSYFPKRCFLTPHIMPGKYKVRWTGAYHVNNFQTVTRTILSDWVEVLDEVTK